MNHLNPWRGGRPLIVTSSVVGMAGIVPTVIGFGIDPRRALFSYLWAWVYWGGIALGSLMLLAIFHTARARWPVVFRRMIETTAGSLPFFAVLFVPILIWVHPIYPWVHPANLPPKVQQHVFADRAWLNPSFWWSRSAVYLLSWAVIAELLLRWSREQDTRREPLLTVRMRRLATGGLPWISFALSFATLDWVMSLDPRWRSSIFGLYVFTGVFLAAIALQSLLTVVGRGQDLFGELVNDSHRLALGRFMLAFTAFWAYIAFDQYMLIWIGDLPDEVHWVHVRTLGRWAWMAWLVVGMRFLIPMFALLSRELKTHPRRLAAISLWILAGQAVDTYWLILPGIDEGRPTFRWTDLTAFMGLGGVAVAIVAWRLHGRYTVPLGDPYVNESARYSHP